MEIFHSPFFDEGALGTRTVKERRLKVFDRKDWEQKRDGLGLSVRANTKSEDSREGSDANDARGS